MSLVQESLPLQPLLGKLAINSAPAAGTMLYFLWTILNENKNIPRNKYIKIIKDFINRYEKIGNLVEREKFASSFFLSRKGFQNFIHASTETLKFANVFFVKIDEITDFIKSETIFNQEAKQRWKIIHNIYNLKNYINPVKVIEYPLRETEEEVRMRNAQKSRL